MKGVLASTLFASLAMTGVANPDNVSVVSSFDELTLEAGRRIRVVRADGRTLEGAFLSGTSDEISLQIDDDSRVLPQTDVYQIYLVERRRGKGAFRGLLVGLGITGALGLATMTQATEEGEGALGFGVGLMFAVPISVAVGAIASPDRRDLVYQNPEVEPPPAPRVRAEIPRSFYAALSGGANYLAGDPFSGANAETPGTSTAYAVRGLYRATGHWGFGGEVLFSEGGSWRWETDGSATTDSRKIVAPGFKVYYFPVVGANELVINGGISAFKQDATRTVERPGFSQRLEETKLDPYFNIGVSYLRYLHPNIGLGADVQYYTGSQIPNPLVLFSVSLSFRSTPPPAR